MGGLVVGISAAYHAAKLCGLDEKLLPSKDVLDTVNQFINDLQEKNNFEGDDEKAIRKAKEKHCQSLTNLCNLRSLVQYLLDDNTWMYFKRNWEMQTGHEQFIANWTYI